MDLAVIRFPKISNFTDLDVFVRIPGVTVRYVTKVSELGTPDLVILPGTKNTISDLCGCARMVWKEPFLNWPDGMCLYGESAEDTR